MKWSKMFNISEDYEISNTGKVRKFKYGKWIEPSVYETNSKLKFTARRKNGSPTSLSVSFMVYKTFVDDVPRGYHVEHKDGNFRNCNVDNLSIRLNGKATLHKKRSTLQSVIRHFTKYQDLTYMNLIAYESKMGISPMIQQQILKLLFNDCEVCDYNDGYQVTLN